MATRPYPQGRTSNLARFGPPTSLRSPSPDHPPAPHSIMHEPVPAFDVVTSTRVEGRARAKLNLFLEVLGRREDGYHELVSVFHEIDWSDRIRVELRPRSESDQLEIHGIEIPGASEDNLVLRAVSAYRSATTQFPSVHIEMVKDIPLGAGLGGGSSDAAFVLHALESMGKKPVGWRNLLRLAAQLGSDVPFFLYGGTALCTGRGEKVSPILSPRRLWFLLVRPDFSLSTARVYGHLRLTDPPRKVNSLASQLVRSGGERPLDCFNRLQEAAFLVAPELRGLCATLSQRTGSSWFVTGSGSVVFSPFLDERRAQQAFHQVAHVGSVEVVLAPSFSRCGKDSLP